MTSSDTEEPRATGAPPASRWTTLSAAAVDAMHFLDGLRWTFPFDMETKFGPRMVMNTRRPLTPAEHARLAPVEAELRSVGITTRETPAGWQVTLWIKIDWIGGAPAPVATAGAAP